MKNQVRIFLSSVVTAIATATAWGGPLTAETSSPPLEQHPSSSEWQFEILSYLWAVNLDGTVGVLGTTSDIDVGFDDVLDNLDFAGSLLAGVRYDRFGFLLDFQYVKVSPSFDTPGSLFSRTDLTMEQVLLDMKASYRIWESDRGWIDLAGGARYMNVDQDITLQPGLAPSLGVSGSEGWWDAVGGLRARYNLTDRLYLTGLVDVGGGSSDLTWQALGGLGFELMRNVDAHLVYRYLHVDYQNRGFTYDVDSQGIGLGLSLQF